MTQDLAAHGSIAPIVDPSKVSSTGWRRTRILVRTPLALTAAAVLIFVTLVSVIGSEFFTHAAQRQNLSYRLMPPFHFSHGMSYILGADTLGRPMLLQLLVATRTSLLIAAFSVAITATLGTLLGILSGYLGGWADLAIMRLNDILQTVPSLLLALVILYVVGSSMTNLIVVLAVTRLPVYLRVARAQTLEIRERVFVEASKALGVRAWRIMIGDVRPMVAPTILTLAMLEIGIVILKAAGLSFIGVGLQRPDVDLGTMVSAGREYLSQAWWITTIPGIVVVIIALAANILSNWLRAVDDPAQSAAFVSTASLDEEAAPK